MAPLTITVYAQYRI